MTSLVTFISFCLGVVLLPLMVFCSILICLMCLFLGDDTDDGI